MRVEKIFIVGAPGAGKTTAAKELAKKINSEFIDTDELIEKQEGKTIPEIFEEKGEKYFRNLENQVIQKIVDSQEKEKIVVSLGGGAITNPENLHKIREKGIVICLYAEPEEILKRIPKNSRPLLKGDNPLEKIKKILEEREKWYRISDFYIDTTNIPKEETIKQIIDFLKIAEKIHFSRVNLAERSYDVIVGENLFQDENLKEFIRKKLKRILKSAKKTFLISTSSIKEVPYGEENLGKVVSRFLSESFELHGVNLPDGENTKDAFYAIFLWNFLADKDLKKNDFLTILGGGVLGDLGGFVAGTYLRGINYINIPTTLLAQVDSSIGGKTGINTSLAKNMVGIIHQPSIVISDISILKTLPEEDFLSGLGEVLKYSVSLEKELLEFLMSKRREIFERDSQTLKYIVSKCADIKARIVSEDEKEEKKTRMLLNFGHTIGHALESALNFSIPHGFAVSVGILVETKISDMILSKNLFPQCIEIFRQFFNEKAQIILKRLENINSEKFFSSMKLDKKTRGDEINFTLLEEFGKSKIEKIKIEEFESVVRSVFGEVLKNLSSAL